MVKTEAFLQFLRLIGDGGRIARIARIDRHGNRPSFLVGEGSVDDDRSAFLAVPVMAEPCKGTRMSFVVAARDIVKNQRAMIEMTACELLLDPCLSGQEPIERVIQLILIGVAHREFFREGGRMPKPCGGKFRRGVDQTLRNHGEHEIAFPTGLRGDNGIESELLYRSEYGFYVAMGKRLLNGKGGFRGNERFAPQRLSKRLDLLFGPLREIGEGPLLYLFSFPPRFPQENRRSSAAIGHPFHMHDHYINI